MVEGVIASKTVKVVNDFTQLRQELQDGYFKGSSMRSLLVLPLIRKGEIRGVVYIENNDLSATGAEPVFTKSIISLTEFICNQAVISLDSAILLKETDLAIEEKRLSEKYQAMMSHELRTSMNGLIHFAHDVKEYKEDEKKRDYYIGRTIDSAKESLRIVGDILDVELFKQNEFVLRHYDFSLKKLIESVYQEYLPLCAMKSLDFKIPDISELPDRMVGDSVRIKQILKNLVSNAIKYTERGFVAVGVEVQGWGDTEYKLCLSIEDSGCGISEGFTKELYDPFRREEHTTGPSQKGVGLGLYIVKLVAQSHGGSVEACDLPGEKSGALFIVTLPVA